MKILVFGADGFIGSAICRCLADGNEVIRATHQASRGDIGVDLLNSRDVKRTIVDVAPQVIINCAGIVENSEKAKLNIEMTRNILEAAAESKTIFKRIIVLGSAGEYGLVSSNDSLIKEDFPVAPVSDYTSAKADEVKLAIEFADRHKLPLVVARIFNPIGVGMNKRFLIPQLVEQVKEFQKGTRKNLELSRLDSSRDYISVRDVASAIKAIIIGTPKHKIYNIGSGKNTSNIELVQMVLSGFNIREHVTILETRESPEPTLASRADITRLKEDFGWSPKESLDKIIMDIRNDA